MNGGGGTGAWLPPRRAPDGVAVRLFAVPYAGGDTPIFAPWREEIPWEIELCPVQLPGRGRRLGQPAYADLRALVSALAEGLAPALDTRFALFGHSMGALVCFELARELRRRGGPQPDHLLVSARGAPQLPSRYSRLSALEDRELLGQLHRRYGYTAPDIDGLEELVELMLPTIRADVMVSEGYVHADEAPLDCPITAFGGRDDPTVTHEELAAWGQQTRGRFETRLLPGGHFFLHSEWRFLVRFVVDGLLSTPRP